MKSHGKDHPDADDDDVRNDITEQNVDKLKALIRQQGQMFFQVAASQAFLCLYVNQRNHLFCLYVNQRNHFFVSYVNQRNHFFLIAGSHVCLSAGLQWSFELGKGCRDRGKTDCPGFPGLVNHVQAAPVARLHQDGEGVGLVHQGDQEGEDEGDEEGGDARLVSFLSSAHPSLASLACSWVLTWKVLADL